MSALVGALAEAQEQRARAEQAEAERDELRRLQQVWLMSPEAAQRLDGYRQLAEKCATLEAERDEARAKCDTLREALGAALVLVERIYSHYKPEERGSKGSQLWSQREALDVMRAALADGEKP